MKIKTAITAMLSDAETSIGSKNEIISFLRKYSCSARPITHYSCRGQSTAAIKKLLTTMGMVEGEDFTVVSSTYDPEFNQIRWASSLKKVSELVASLSAVTLNQLGSPFFDQVYAKLMTKGDITPLMNKLCDTEGNGTVSMAVPDTLDQNHVAVKALNRTRSIVTTLYQLSVQRGL